MGLTRRRVLLIPAVLLAGGFGGGCGQGGDGAPDARALENDPRDAPAASDDPAPLFPESEQHVVVAVDSVSSTTGTLYRLQRADGGWQRIGEPVPVVVGSGGVAKEREGDGRAPQGVFPLESAFGYRSEPPPGTLLPYEAMGPATVCVDDPDSRHYNQIVHAGEVESDWQSSEPMRRDLSHGDDLYELGVTVAYNAENIPGAGSCIFLHVWRNRESPTAGCTAMPEEDLRELLGWLDPGRRPILVQGTRAHLEELRSDERIPYPLPESR